MLARSLPLSGSLNPWQYQASPLAISGSHRSFCSSVAFTITVGPVMPMVKSRPAAGARAKASSSFRIICSMAVFPIPPYSTGQAGANQRFAPSFFANSRANGTCSSLSKKSSLPSNPGGSSASRNARRSARHCSVSGENVKSMGRIVDCRLTIVDYGHGEAPSRSSHGEGASRVSGR
jgi:hypothetical protein